MARTRYEVMKEECFARTHKTPCHAQLSPRRAAMGFSHWPGWTPFPLEALH